VSVIYLSPGTGGLTTERHEERVFEREVNVFTYNAVGLPDLSADDYQESGNPLGPALGALMKTSRLGKVAQKYQALRAMAASRVDEARKALLANVVETYLILADDEQTALKAMVSRPEGEEVRAMISVAEQLSQSRGRAFSGCYVATLTPFDAADRLDEGVLRAHVEWLVEHGAQGLCPAGTTGEFLYLSADEKQRIVRETVRAAAGQAPVIAGVWGLREAETLTLARAAEDAGAQGVFLPPPIYYPANDAAVFAHYAAVHAATSLPVFAYNIPQYAANEVSLACLERLFAEGIIAGAKDSTGKAERVGALVERFGARGTIFAASDGFASEGRRLGADGFISAIANVAPALFAQLWAGDDSLQPRVDSLRTALKQVGSIPALKHLLARRGFAFGDARIPYSALTAEQRSMLDALEL
jgi:4-hydroxy-tetrahydrodipicolinate synthase